MRQGIFVSGLISGHLTGSAVRGLSFSGGSLCNSVLSVLELRRVIAATALVHGMTIMTRNTVDFEPTGVQILNPWTWAGSE